MNARHGFAGGGSIESIASRISFSMPPASRLLISSIGSDGFIITIAP